MRKITKRLVKHARKGGDKLLPSPGKSVLKASPAMTRSKAKAAKKTADEHVSPIATSLPPPRVFVGQCWSSGCALVNVRRLIGRLIYSYAG